MNIDGYELVNTEKLNRAAEGSQTSSGGLQGGVGYEDETLLLATYDKLGGLIMKDGNKVKTGSFWNFKADAPQVKPVVIFLIAVDGEIVEVPENEPMPIQVKAQKILNAAREKKAAEKKAAKDAKTVKGAAKAATSKKAPAKKSVAAEIEE